MHSIMLGIIALTATNIPTLDSHSNIVDPQLVRRLNIKADYDVPCSLISDPITKSTVTSLANSHFAQIDGPTICGKGNLLRDLFIFY